MATTVTLLYAAHSEGSGYTLISGSPTFALTGGETLVVLLCGAGQSTDLPAPTDSAGALVKQLPVYNTFFDSGTTHGGVYTEFNAAAGSHTITPPVIAGGADGLIGVLKISGMAASLAVRTAVKNRQSTTSTTFSLTTDGTPVAGDVAIGFRTHENNVASTSTVTQPAGWTSLWQFLNGTISLPTDESYLILGSGGALTGTWTTTDAAVTDTSGAILILKPAALITSQPADQTVNLGGIATFSVSATASAGSATFQWQDNSGGGVFANISGETSSTLSIANAVAGQNGRRYQVVVTDSNGSVTSSSAALYVNYPSRVVVPQFDLAGLDVIGFQSLLDIRGWFAPSGTVGLQVEKWFAEELDAASGATGSGVGAAAGAGAAAGVGASSAVAAGASSGTATASGAGASTVAAAGSSSGTGAASGVGQAAVSAVGASSGVATAAAVGASTAASAGSSAGAGAANGVSASTAASAGSSSGTGAASGVGASTAAAVGSSTGSSAAAAASSSAQSGAGSSAGASTVSGVGASTANAVGSSSGVGTASGVSVSGSSAVGSASGTGIASGVGSAVFSGVGSSTGTSTASAVGASSAGSQGAASGSASCSGAGASTSESVGASAGSATVSGVGASSAAAVGAAAGAATVDGVGSAIAAGQGAGLASGSATALGIGIGVFDAVGIAVGTSTALATGQSLVPFTAIEAQWLEGVVRLHGLIDPLTVSATSRTDGTVAQTVSDVSGTVTITTTASPLGSLSKLAEYLELLARVHGLIDPLVVTETTRSDGALNQTLSVVGGVTTVERV